MKAIDGTTLRVPNTQENKYCFLTQKNKCVEVALIKASINIYKKRYYSPPILFLSASSKKKLVATEIFLKHKILKSVRRRSASMMTYYPILQSQNCAFSLPSMAKERL